MATPITSLTKPLSLNDAFLAQEKIRPLLSTLDNNRTFEVFTGKPSFPVDEIREKLERSIRAVCRIYSTEKKRGMGTGFVVGEHLILTNHHVLRTEDDCRTHEAHFFYEGKSEIVKVKFDPDKRFITSPQPKGAYATDTELDFTLVAIEDHADLRTVFAHPISLTAGDTTERDGKTPVRTNTYVIHHPKGGYKEWGPSGDAIELYGSCEVKYTSSTLGGSSGSPVLDAYYNLIGLHSSSDEDKEKKEKWNVAIRIEKIREALEKIGILKQIKAGELPPLSPERPTPSQPASCFKNKNDLKAFDNLVLFFLALKPEEPEKTVKRAYESLLEMLPHLEDIRSLYDKIFPSLPLFPQFTEQQLRLALALAKWYENRSPNHLQPMHYYAQALSIAKVHHPDQLHHVHSLASKLFMRTIRTEILEKKQFQQQLDLAKRRDDKEQFQKVLTCIDLLKKYRCDLQDDEVIKGLYEQAQQVFLTSNVNKSFNETFLPRIQKALKEPYTPSHHFATQGYAQELENYRTTAGQKFEHLKTPDVSLIRHFQQEIQAEFLSFFRKTFLQDAFAILGPPPCSYDLHLMGSAAREELCLYSNLQWMILIEDEKHRDYFKKLAQLIELQITSLATAHAGLHIDIGGNPAVQPDLINTPQKMAQLQRSIEGVEDDPYQLHHSLRKTLSLYTDNRGLETTYRKHMHLVLSPTLAQSRAISLLKTRLQSYKKHFAHPFEQLKVVDLKTHFVELIHYALHDVALYYGIETLNTLDLIDALVSKTLFTEQSGALLKQVIGQIYMIRWRLHRYYNEQKETAAFHPDPHVCVLLKEEQVTLSRAFWLILYPLYRTLENILGQDLPSTLFNQLDLSDVAFHESVAHFQTHELAAFMETFVHHLLNQKVSLETHRSYYHNLSQRASLEPLRVFYLHNLGDPTLMENLAAMPTRAGFRQAYRMESERLLSTLQTLKAPSSEMVLHLPSLGKVPLPTEIVQQILDANGNIQRHYKDALHPVARAKGVTYDLHFKQKPAHPMMEYAMGNLTARLMGKSAPQTLLVRMEVEKKGNKKVYPVLISETIQGQSLLNVKLSQLDRKQLTRLLLCYALIRPGDGRHSNYVVDGNMRVLCIDNDIAFVEPIVQEWLAEKVQLNSILFCLEDPFILDADSVKEFNRLEGDIIIHNWLEDLVMKEKEYESLFSPEELKKFYTENPNESFTASLLLRKGTILTLGMQLCRLQHFLRQAQQPTALDLLDQLITFNDSSGESLIGPKVSLSYRNAIASSKDLKERLKKATGSNPHRSITSAQAQKASLGRIPTLEEIEKKEKYSLERAGQEILFVTAINAYASITEDRALKVDFSRLSIHNEPDIDHQEVLLKAVHLFLADKNTSLPEKISIANCAVLDSNALALLLHQDITYLDLRNCPKLTNTDVAKIEKQCPKLRELYLSGCEKINALEKGTVFKQALVFPKLEVLHVARCRLEKIQLEAPLLFRLKIDKNPKLLEKNITLRPLWQTIYKPRVWQSSPLTHTLTGHINPVWTLIQLQDGNLASGSWDNTIKIWNKEGTCIHTLKGHTNSVITLMQLQDGNLASGSDDNTIKIWNKEGTCIHTLKGHTNSVKTLIQLQDGNLASGSWDNTIKIWNNEGTCIHTLTGHTDTVITLIQLQDGNLASGSDDKTIKIWNKEGTCIHTLTGHTDWVGTLIQLQDGNLASGSSDKTIKIWNKEGTCIHTLTGHTDTVWTLMQLQDGNLASGSGDKTIKIWNKEGTCIHTLKGHTNSVITLMQLQDGNLASGSGDKTIKIWNKEGTCIHTLTGHTDLVITLIQLQDGNLASGSLDNTIKIWNFLLSSNKPNSNV